jgi:hypothetical protein
VKLFQATELLGAKLREVKVFKANVSGEIDPSKFIRKPKFLRLLCHHLRGSFMIDIGSWFESSCIEGFSTVDFLSYPIRPKTETEPLSEEYSSLKSDHRQNPKNGFKQDSLNMY